MAYDMQTWNCGETITAEKLNHMEDGIANAGATFLIFTPDPNVNTLKASMTISEIEDHLDRNEPIIPIAYIYMSDGTYYVPLMAQFDESDHAIINVPMYHAQNMIYGYYQIFQYRLVDNGYDPNNTAWELENAFEVSCAVRGVSPLE